MDGLNAVQEEIVCIYEKLEDMKTVNITNLKVIIIMHDIIY